MAAALGTGIRESRSHNVAALREEVRTCMRYPEDHPMRRSFQEQLREPCRPHAGESPRRYTPNEGRPVGTPGKVGPPNPGLRPYSLRSHGLALGFARAVPLGTEANRNRGHC